MAKLMNLAILLLVTMLHTALAADYTVGGSSGWHYPATPSFYTDWAANYTFRVNDTLVFNFVNSSHDVVILNKDNFNNCSFNGNLGIFFTPPVRIPLNRTGEFYFSCTYTGHCLAGMKLSVNVSASSSSTPSAPGPSSSTPSAPGPSSNSPPGSGTTSPPPQNAATPLAASFSLLLITIATSLSLFQF